MDSRIIGMNARRLKNDSAIHDSAIIFSLKGSCKNGEKNRA
jgi:hypothetical protein